MTAEELKDHVRKYADEHLPGWKEATVVVSATLHIGVRPTAEEEAIAAGLRALRADWINPLRRYGASLVPPESDEQSAAPTTA